MDQTITIRKCDQTEVVEESVGWSACRGLGWRAGDPGCWGPWHGDTFE